MKDRASIGAKRQEYLYMYVFCMTCINLLMKPIFALIFAVFVLRKRSGDNGWTT